MGTKRQSEIWNRIVSNKTTTFLLGSYDQRQFCLNQCYLLDQSSSLYAQLFNIESWKKYWIISEDLFKQILTIHFTIWILQFQMLHCPVTKQLCFPLCTVKCSLVSEWIYPANPHFFSCLRINNFFKFRTAIIIKVFHFFFHYIAEKIAKFCFVAK